MIKKMIFYHVRLIRLQLIFKFNIRVIRNNRPFFLVDGHAQDGRALSGRGPLGGRRARCPDRGADGQVPERLTPRACPGHHVRGNTPGGRRFPATRHEPAAGRRHLGARSPGRRSARVCRPRGGTVHRVV